MPGLSPIKSGPSAPRLPRNQAAAAIRAPAAAFPTALPSGPKTPRAACPLLLLLRTLLALPLVLIAAVASGCGAAASAGRPDSVKEAPTPAAAGAPAADSAALETPGPRAVLSAFDSLLEAGDLPAAKALCEGQVLAMFDFLAAAHRRMAGVIDTSRSTEEVLADSVAGDRAWVKVRSRVEFRRPFLGQTLLESVQAVHLNRSARGWRLAEFEELADSAASVSFRGRTPPEPAAPSETASPGLLPISPEAPAEGAEADWLRYRVRFRNGAALADRAVLDARQRLDSTVSPSEWILVNRLAEPPKRATAESLPDSLGPYLAGNAYLDLDDSLLHASAAKAVAEAAGPVPAAPMAPIARGAGRHGAAPSWPGPAGAARQAAAIRAWVTGGFRFELGAVLFGSSREVLRDMRGDCSEAAILTAALLRARGIPSRVALGFASAGRGVFVGHAWTEAWLGSQSGWVGVDAALGQFPAGVERFKLAQLDGRGDMRIAATNVMLSSLSNLEIEILEARQAGKRLPLTAHPGAAEEGGRFFAEILEGFGRGAR